MKLNLGSGKERFSGFTNVDLYDDTADIRADICQVPLEDGCASEIKCIQVIEHIPYNKSQDLFKEMYRLLESGGFADIETPDIDVVCYNILREGLLDKWIYNLVGEYYRAWDKDRYDDWEHNAASIHRNPWNEERLRRIAEPLGFVIERKDWNESIYKCEENLYVRLTKV
jgi:predicted SAM-dependent methyltransferase